NTYGLWNRRSFLYFIALLIPLSSTHFLLHRYSDPGFITFTNVLEIFGFLITLVLTLYIIGKLLKKYRKTIKSSTQFSFTSRSLSPQAHSLSLFRAEVLEFHNDQRQWGEIARVQPLSKTISIWFFIGTITVLFIFLLFAPYSRKETVKGYLKPPAGSARVLATQVGTVSALYVREGESVQADQPLVSISSPQVDKDGSDVNTSILDVLNKQKETIHSQIAAEEIRTQTERRRLEDLLKGLSQEVTHFQTQLETQKERIKISEELVETANVLKGQGYISAKELGERKIGLLDHQLSVDSLSQQMIARKNEIIEKKASLEELPIIAADRLRQLKADLSSTEQRISEVKARSAYILRAPIAGRISSLPATLGQPAEPGRLLLTIIPEGDPLEAELFVPTRAAGFVKPGQRVRILYDAFPYQHYGTHGGKVSKMSQTMLTKFDVTGPIPLEEPAYRVTAILDRTVIESEQGNILLQPDMLLRADIVLDRRPLLEWIFNPIWGAGKRQTVH
ncbi:MAG: HlyD family secretion protein, partial [Hyphomicrobium sp.]